MGCSSSKKRVDRTKMFSTSFFLGDKIFRNLSGNDLEKDYEIQQQIGQGAQGIVKLVKHKLSGELRVMKIIEKKHYKQANTLCAEVQITKYFDHPNIVKLYDLYSDPKNFYIIQEYLTGGELFNKIAKRDLVHRGNRLAEKDVIEFMTQVFQALNYCHKKGVMHRDIKPQNLLFDTTEDDPYLKVIDFGLAATLKATGDTPVGTPLYVAPEILKMHEYDYKCDVWSCGIMLFQLLTGRFPFDVNDTATKRLKESTQIVEAVEQLTTVQLQQSIQILNKKQDIQANKYLSKEAKDIISKMLIVEQEERASVEELLEMPWIKTVQKNNKIIQADVLNNLSSFHSEDKLKNAIYSLIATHLSQKEEKKKLMEQFKIIDANHDGEVSFDELFKAYKVILKDKNETVVKFQVQKIFEQAGFSKEDQQNNNNKLALTFTQFFSAAQGYAHLLQKDKLEAAFKMFDQDGNGYITMNEIQEIFKGIKIEQMGWEDLKKNFDKDKDGKISHEEFLAAFKKM